MNQSEQKTGMVYAALSYVIWGILPGYWKLVDYVPSKEILAHRILWSFVFMIILLFLTNKSGEFFRFVVFLWKHPKKLAALATATLLVTGNWYIYIWAVNSGKIIEASMGYYINPLVSVLLAVIVLKEKLSKIQAISFLIALAGVLILTIGYGSVPWVAILLAVTFGLYGLAKKMIQVDSTVGLTLETMFVLPVALIYVLVLGGQGTSSFGMDVRTSVILVGAGIMTATPLLFFAKGAQRLPLSMMGFFQYIAPTLMLILGVFAYHEHFSHTHLLSFMFIWAALVVYSFSHTKWAAKKAGTAESGASA